MSYWCHECERDVAVVADAEGEVTCRECGGCFVEKREAPPAEERAPAEDPFQQMIMQLFDGITARRQRQGVRSFVFGGNGMPGGRVTVRVFDGPMMGGLGSDVFEQMRERRAMAMDDEEFERFLQRMFDMSSAKGAPPAAQSAIDALRRSEVTSVEDMDGAVCCVCQDAYAVGDTLAHMPCGHFFHADCVEPWLKLHNTCPECRFEIKSDEC